MSSRPLALFLFLSGCDSSREGQGPGDTGLLDTANPAPPREWICGVDGVPSEGVPVGMVSLEEAPASTPIGGGFTAGDQDGDGCSDLLVSGLGDDDCPGINTLYSGPVIGRFHASPGQEDANWAAELVGSDGDWATYAASGDVNGDGLADWLIGGFGINDDLGGAYVVYGPVYGNLRLWPQADAILLGQDDGAGSDNNECADLNGDGFADLLVSTLTPTIDGDRTSGFYVVNGPVHGTSSLADADAIYYTGGYAAEYRVVGRFSAGGDLDGDGLHDVTMESLDRGGAAWVVLSPRAGPVSLDDADAVILGGGDTEGYGDISSGGDVDGDGYGDLIMGLAGLAGLEGKAYLFHGPLVGEHYTAQADAIVWAPGGMAEVGRSVSLEQDMDGDGRADLAIGAPGAEGAPNRGAVFLFYEPFEGTVNAFEEAEAVLYTDHQESFSSTGCYLDSIGDINGDGYGDLHIGISPDYLVFGGPR